jgi:hypothetical protein
LYIHFNHVYHVKCKYLVYVDKGRITADTDSDKRQTRLLVREGAPQKTRPQLSNRNKHLVMSHRWCSTPRMTRLTDRQLQCDSDSDASISQHQSVTATLTSRDTTQFSFRGQHHSDSTPTASNCKRFVGQPIRNSVFISYQECS